jgi:radical SAM superfamily enzyme YgiQ (UPF0313 family)
MIRSLRKRHLYTWVFLAVLLPIVFFMAYSVNPSAVFEDNFSIGEGDEVFEQVVKQLESDDPLMKVSLRTNGTEQQLEIDLRESIVSPAPSVYISEVPSVDVSQARVAGPLGGKGVQYFALDSLPVKSILIYDEIKKETLFQANF